MEEQGHVGSGHVSTTGKLGVVQGALGGVEARTAEG